MRRSSTTRSGSIGSRRTLEVSRDEIEEQAARVPPRVRAAIAAAARNIEKVARRQRPQGWRVTTTAGVTVEQRVTPLDRVGCYVPGGRYPLPSSLLMTAIPARAAGVREIIVACPAAGARRHGRRPRGGRDEALQDGRRAGHRRDWRTERKPYRGWTRSSGPAISTWRPPRRSLRPTARSIFMPARPRSSSFPTQGNPEWIAADLIAQAEHDPQARALLITTSRQIASKVARAVSRQMPRHGPARESLARHGGIIIAGSRAEAADLANRAAAEHLVCDDDQFAAERPGRRRDLRRRVHRTGRRRLRHRIESRAADQRRRAISWRPSCSRFRARVDDSENDAPGVEEPGADGDDARARGRARGARAIDRGAARPGGIATKVAR